LWTPQQAPVQPDAGTAAQPLVLVLVELCRVLRAGAPLEQMAQEVRRQVAELARRLARLVSERAASARASPPRQRLPLQQYHGNACALIPHVADRSSSSASSSR